MPLKSIAVDQVPAVPGIGKRGNRKTLSGVQLVGKGLSLFLTPLWKAGRVSLAQCVLRMDK